MKKQNTNQICEICGYDEFEGAHLDYKLSDYHNFKPTNQSPQEPNLNVLDNPHSQGSEDNNQTKDIEEEILKDKLFEELRKCIKIDIKTYEFENFANKIMNLGKLQERERIIEKLEKEKLTNYRMEDWARKIDSSELIQFYQNLGFFMYSLIKEIEGEK